MRAEAAAPPNETQLRQCLVGEGLSLPPVSLSLKDPKSSEVPLPPRGFADGVLEARWRGKPARFVFEYKAQSTPKALDTALAQALHSARATGLLPMVVLPYLSDEALRRLEEEGVSGVDLCGNGVILAPGMAVWRSGRLNRFKDSRPIRNVFRGTSSLIARSFLLRPAFTSLVDLRAFALERLGAADDTGEEARLSKGTVSKVVQTLEEEQIVVRGEGNAVRLASAGRLLERLRTGYIRPTGRRLEGKTPLPPREAWLCLKRGNVRRVATGDGSAGHYGLLSGADRLGLYVGDLDAAARLLEVETTRVFPNVLLIEDKGEAAYFDARAQGDVLWASPIQTWLELSTGGPRERAAAEELEARLLRGEAAAL